MSVIAAGTFARETGGPGVEFSTLIFETVFQQPFVNAAEVLYGQIAVVDPGAEGIFGTPRKLVDDRGQLRVRHTHAANQSGVTVFKQPAVIGGQPQRGIALGDTSEQATQFVPHARGGGREREVFITLVAHVFTDAAQAVGVIALVTYRQKIAVFGVKNEQQTVKQHQRRFADPFEVLTVAWIGCFGIGSNQGIGKIRKHGSENAMPEIL